MVAYGFVGVPEVGRDGKINRVHAVNIAFCFLSLTREMTEQDITIQTHGATGVIMAKFHEGSIRKIGEVVQLEDGFWYYWNDGKQGAIEAWVMRAIADRLDELNKPWVDYIEKNLTK